MTAPLRVGILGLSHDHVWGNLAALTSGDLGRVAAVAEPAPRLRERFARDHGGVDLYPTYDGLLDPAPLRVEVAAEGRPPLLRGRGYGTGDRLQPARQSGSSGGLGMSILVGTGDMLATWPTLLPHPVLDHALGIAHAATTFAIASPSWRWPFASGCTPSTGPGGRIFAASKKIAPHTSATVAYAAASPRPVASPPRKKSSMNGENLPKGGGETKSICGTVPLGPAADFWTVQSSVAQPKAISPASRWYVGPQSFVPSRMITQSSGACDSRSGPSIERPSRWGSIQESVATVRPLRPSSMTR